MRLLDLRPGPLTHPLGRPNDCPLFSDTESQYPAGRARVSHVAWNINISLPSLSIKTPLSLSLRSVHLLQCLNSLKILSYPRSLHQSPLKWQRSGRQQRSVMASAIFGGDCVVRRPRSGYTHAVYVELCLISAHMCSWRWRLAKSSTGGGGGGL